jgi:hypothetical protein
MAGLVPAIHIHLLPGIKPGMTRQSVGAVTISTQRVLSYRY